MELQLSIVQNGTGAGKFVEETMVSVNADATLGSKHFSNWSVVSGPAVAFTDANSPSTSFMMPEQDIVVKANYVQNSTGGSDHTPGGSSTNTPEDSATNSSTD